MNFISRLAKSLKLYKDDVEEILFIAPERYKVYSIPKRTHGSRLIAQPSKELKECQRAFQTLFNFPIHSSAMAYREGKSIKENAIAHKDCCYLLKLDIENYFNSITPDIFWNIWQLSLKELPDKQDREWIEKLLFWNLDGRLVLSVGAPSSPTISNFCMCLFDGELSEFCQRQGIVYTRYADDLTFSTNEQDLLFSIPLEVEKLLFRMFKGALRLNRVKTTFSSKAHNRHVTGITITNDGKISLGRERKRYIKHKVHCFKLNKLDIYEIMHLKGVLSFARHIEPSFYESLIKKYSRELIINIFKVKDE